MSDFKSKMHQIQFRKGGEGRGGKGRGGEERGGGRGGGTSSKVLGGGDRRPCSYLQAAVSCSSHTFV